MTSKELKAGFIASGYKLFIMVRLSHPVPFPITHQSTVCIGIRTDKKLIMNMTDKIVSGYESLIPTNHAATSFLLFEVDTLRIVRNKQFLMTCAF